MKILIIEDDERDAKFLLQGLTAAGHVIEHLANGEDGYQRAKSVEFDAMIIDRMLPSKGGVAIARDLRMTGINTPIVFVTALGGLDDRVEGLESGADDYLVKPFAMIELLARLNALRRRSNTRAAETVLRQGRLEMDLLKREVRHGGNRIELQAQEFKILEYLLRNEGCVVTKSMMLRDIWSINFDPKTSVVETHICRLRNKLGGATGRTVIMTVHGLGYRLAE